MLLLVTLFLISCQLVDVLVVGAGVAALQCAIVAVVAVVVVVVAV